MCGIAGSLGSAPCDFNNINACIKHLSHRGPDASGNITVEIGTQSATLIHSRLAIIDLEERSNQPYVWQNLVLVFNGEIYNFKEVRDQLTAAGYQFATKSDTEVLIKAWHYWGHNCLDRLEGMWAFAIADKNEGTLTLCRDRFGEKPLYYAVRGDKLYFGSEPKAIDALSGVAGKVDLNKLQTYMVNGFRSICKDDQSFIEDIKELPSGTLAVLNNASFPKTKKYWQLRYQPDFQMSTDFAVERSRELLEQSLKWRLRADVPIAFCLSGGVDSTSLACLAAKKFGVSLDTFSIIDSDPRYNENRNIDTVVRSLGCKSHKLSTSSEGFLNRMRKLVNLHDGPVPTISYYVHSFLSEAIAREGFKVSVSGTGADEIYTGYYDHYSFWLAGQSESNDISSKLTEWRATYGKHVNNPELQDPMIFARFPDKRSHLYPNQALFNSYLREQINAPFEEKRYAPDLLRNRMMNELFDEVVPVILRADDSNSMGSSIENRSPFLDRNLVEFLYTVPNPLLIQNGLQKWLLRSSMEGILADEVRLNDQKRGFNASINSLIDRNNKETRESLLDDSPIFDIINKDAVEEFMKGDLENNSFSKFMFSFISAKLFIEDRQ